MEDIIVFGKGEYFKRKKQKLLQNYTIIAFIDNDISKDDASQKTQEGIPILHPSQITLLKQCYIIIMSGHFISMWQQLLEYGVGVERILFGCNFPPYEEEDIFDPKTILFAHKNFLFLQTETGKTYSFCNEAEYQPIHQMLLRHKFKYQHVFSALPLHPISNIFGLNRGTPIDRYYINTFLHNYQSYITGDVLEIAENTYTHQFGRNVSNSYILHVEGGQDNIIKGNFATGEGIIENMVNCIICTQTLPFIFDLSDVAQNMIKMLKPNGVLLITVPGITQISQYDMQRWGHYWSFTDASLKQLFLKAVPEENITIHTFGNVKAATAFLYGLAAEELDEVDLNCQDTNYQLLITAVIRR